MAKVDVKDISGKKVGLDRARRRRLRRRGQRAPAVGGGEVAAGQGAGPAPTRPRAAARSAARKTSRGSRRAPVAPVRVNRSPRMWVGGGQAFGPRPRDYEYTMPKKARKKALRSALSLRAREQKLIVLDQFQVEGGKTRSGGRGAGRPGCAAAGPERAHRRRPGQRAAGPRRSQPARVQVAGRPRVSTSTTSSTTRPWS